MILELIGLFCMQAKLLENNVSYFDSFGVEHFPKEIKTFIDCCLSIRTNIFRIQVYDSIMCEYFYIDFTNFMLAERP